MPTSSSLIRQKIATGERSSSGSNARQSWNDFVEAQKKKKRAVVLRAALILLALSFCAGLAAGGIPVPAVLAVELFSKDPFLFGAVFPAASVIVSQEETQEDLARDTKELYNLARAGFVETMRLDVYADGRDSLAALEDPARAAVLRLPTALTLGSDGFVVGNPSPNATVEVKGEPKRNRKYHSFKIRMKDSGGQFMGQSIINLKKAYGGPTRAEEKFAFDLFSSLPDMMSLRTLFVRLYIRDMEVKEAGYQDYGLYTMVEQPDKYYFSNRGIDSASHLYVARDFNFTRTDVLLADTDPLYKKASFESVLNKKEGEGHDAILEMLAAVDDPQADIGEVMEEYFDRENLLTWLAMNVLLGNKDCVRGGYLLYKPASSSRWRFIPADMSEAMPAALDPDIAGVMVSGLSMFSGNLLYEKFLSREENLLALRERVAQLLEWFDAEAVSLLTDQYQGVLREYLLENPDRGMLRQQPEAVIAAVSDYRAALEGNVRVFEETIFHPRRVELLPARLEDAREVILRWTESASPAGEEISYRLEIFAGERKVTERTLSGTTEYRMAGLEAGSYTWKITAADASGRESGCSATLSLEDGGILYGMGGFIVY